MHIVIERGKVWKLKDLKPFSIALDGAVSGPEMDNENHKYSFDHHAGCLRFCTLATCLQAHHAILLGLDPEPYTILINDVDSDVCAAIWCLKNPHRCKEPQVIKLIDAIGKGDMYGGAFDNNGMKKIVEWICAPQTDSIKNADYEKLSNDGLMPILESILHRMDLYANGEHSIEVSKHAPHGEFKILRSENGWTLFESNDPHILANIWHANFERAVIIRHLPDKSLAVTITKKSDFIDNFPLETIYKELNKLEKGWGGSSCIGGAPRNPDGSRSNLKLEIICQVIDNIILKNVRNVSKSKEQLISIKEETENLDLDQNVKNVNTKIRKNYNIRAK